MEFYSPKSFILAQDSDSYEMVNVTFGNEGKGIWKVGNG